MTEPQALEQAPDIGAVHAHPTPLQLDAKLIRDAAVCAVRGRISGDRDCVGDPKGFSRSIDGTHG